MIPLRSWIIPIGAALVLLAIGVRATAADSHSLRIKVSLSCQDVQAIVALVGWDQLARRAREAGASEGLVEEARKCLPSSNR